MLLDIKTLDAFAEKLAKALEEGRIEDAARVAAGLSSRRAARVLAKAEPESVGQCLLRMEPVKAGRTAGYMPPELAAKVLLAMPKEEAARFLAKVPPDHALGMLNALEPQTQAELLAAMDEEARASLEELRLYPPDSAGAAMTTHFLALPSDATVEQALKAITSAPPEIEKSSYVYVVDAQAKPEGVVSVRDLVRQPPARALSEAMSRNLVVVRTGDSAVEAARLLRNRRFAMLPVVDGEGVLSGVLTLDDAADLLAENVADQFASIGGDVGDESFFTPPIGAVRRRLPWMSLNVFLNLAAVAVITGFEDTIAQVAILAAFLPMITDMGGNVGIQSLSVAIRSIALGEVQWRDYPRALAKEVSVGLVNGLALGALFGLIAMTLRRHFVLGAVAGVALGVNVLVAGVVGGCLPFAIKKLGKDPAMMTGPLLTTITDITGVTIYLGLSTLFLARLVG